MTVSVSVRAYLVAGAAAATATTIALAPVQVTPADVAVPAHSTTTQPALSQPMVELLAAARRMTAAVPAPVLPAPVPGSAPVTGAPILPTPNAVVIAPQNTAGDSIVNVWNNIVQWINYGVDLVNWATNLVPVLGIIGDQVSIIYYNLVLPVADSFVVGLVAPVVDAPLDLNVWANGIRAVGSAIGTGLVNTAIAEFNYFFGWLIPPAPPLSSTETAQTTALSSVAPTRLLSTAFGDVGETLTSAFKGLTARPAAAAEEISAAAEDTFAAVKNSVRTVSADIDAATSDGADQLQDTVGDAVKQLAATTTATAATDEVTNIPKSVRRSLQLQKPTTDSTTNTAPRSRIKDVSDGVRNGTADLKSNVKKATDGLRNAVKDAAKSAHPKIAKTDSSKTNTKIKTPAKGTSGDD